MDTRRENRFSSLVKLKKKEKNYALFYRKKKIFFYIYDVVVKQKIKKRSTIHY